MSRTPQLTLSESDLQIADGKIDGAALRDVFARLFGQLNPVLLQLSRQSSHGISLTDNVQCDLVSGKFSHGVAQTVALHNLKTARAALALGADGQAISAVTVQPTPAPPGFVTVTVYFANTAAAGVNCTLCLLPEGQPSSAVAPNPSIGAPGALKRVKLTGTVDGANKIFTVSAYTTLYAVIVSGVLLTETTTAEGDYTASGAGGTTITFVKAPRKRPYAILAP